MNIKKIAKFSIASLAFAFFGLIVPSQAFAATQTIDLNLAGPNFTSGGYTYSNNVSQSGNNLLRFSASNVKTHYFGTNNPASNTYWAARFEGVNGFTWCSIDDAELLLTAGKDHTNTTNIEIAAQYDDGFPIPEFSDLNKTDDASRSWSQEVGYSITQPWTKGNVYGINVFYQINEILDSLTFDNMTLRIKGTDEAQSLRYVYNDYDTDKAPKLRLTYDDCQ